MLNENSFFADSSGRANLLKDKQAVATNFWINFLGFVALHQAAPHSPKLVPYFRADKVQLNSITDQSGDFVLSLKLANEAGLINDSKANVITRFFALLKQGKIAKVDENLLRAYNLSTAMVKPLPMVKTIVDNFLDAKTTLIVTLPLLYKFAKTHKICQEFVDHAKFIIPHIDKEHVDDDDDSDDVTTPAASASNTVAAIVKKRGRPAGSKNSAKAPGAVKIPQQNVSVVTAAVATPAAPPSWQDQIKNLSPKIENSIQRFMLVYHLWDMDKKTAKKEFAKFDCTAIACSKVEDLITSSMVDLMTDNHGGYTGNWAVVNDIPPMKEKRWFTKKHLEGMITLTKDKVAKGRLLDAYFDLNISADKSFWEDMLPLTWFKKTRYSNPEGFYPFMAITNRASRSQAILALWKTQMEKMIDIFTTISGKVHPSICTRYGNSLYFSSSGNFKDDVRPWVLFDMYRRTSGEEGIKFIELLLERYGKATWLDELIKNMYNDNLYSQSAYRELFHKYKLLGKAGFTRGVSSSDFGDEEIPLTADLIIPDVKKMLEAATRKKVVGISTLLLSYFNDDVNANGMYTTYKAKGFKDEFLEAVAAIDINSYSYDNVWNSLPAILYSCETVLEIPVAECIEFYKKIIAKIPNDYILSNSGEIPDAIKDNFTSLLNSYPVLQEEYANRMLTDEVLYSCMKSKFMSNLRKIFDMYTPLYPDYDDRPEFIKKLIEVGKANNVRLSYFFYYNSNTKAMFDFFGGKTIPTEVYDMVFEAIGVAQTIHSCFTDFLQAVIQNEHDPSTLGKSKVLAKYYSDDSFYKSYPTYVWTQYNLMLQFDELSTITDIMAKNLNIDSKPVEELLALSWDFQSRQTKQREVIIPQKVKERIILFIKKVIPVAKKKSADMDPVETKLIRNLQPTYGNYMFKNLKGTLEPELWREYVAAMLTNYANPYSQEVIDDPEGYPIEVKIKVCEQESKKTGSAKAKDIKDIINNRLGPLLGDIYEDKKHQKALNSIFENFPANKRSLLTQQLKNVILAEPLINSIKGSDTPIKPEVTLDHKQLQALLRLNNFDISSAIATEKRIVKGTNTSWVQYFDKIVNAKDSLDTSKIDLKVTEVADNTSETLDRRTGELYKYYTPNKAHGDVGLKITRSFDVSLHFPEFDEFVKNNPSPTVIPAFHGTGTIAASMILRFGFKVLTSNNAAGTGVTIAGKMLGNGVYVGGFVDKTVGYIRDGKDWSNRWGQIGYLFECDVYLGKEYTDHRKAGNGGDTIRSIEYCLFNPRAQIKIVRAHRVQVTSRRAVEDLYNKYYGSSTTKTNESIEPMKPQKLQTFKQFLKEEGAAGQTKFSNNVIAFTFMENSIPVDDKGTMVDGDTFASKYCNDKITICDSQLGNLVELNIDQDMYMHIVVPDSDEWVVENQEGTFDQWLYFLDKCRKK